MGLPGRPRRRRLPLSATTGDDVFAALADPTRRLLLDRLAETGEQNATELGTGLPMSRQAVAKHLAALEGAGLVRAERRGREVRYQLVPAAVAEATSWLEDIGARWDRRLGALARHLDPARRTGGA